jgi:hypothetical protein
MPDPQRNGDPAVGDSPRGRSGAAFVNCATLGLALQAAGLLYVTFAAQYQFISAQKPGERAASAIQALSLDSGMVIFSFLALGLAKQGKTARTDRALIVVCSLLSAAMNYAAAQAASWRSVAVYVIAPVFLAVITDRVIAGVRRHVLGDDETSVWSGFGRALACAGRAAGMTGLYLLRLVLAPGSTWGGLRRWVLITARVPADMAGDVPRELALALAHYGHLLTPGSGDAPGYRVISKDLGIGTEPAREVARHLNAFRRALAELDVPQQPDPDPDGAGPRQLASARTAA